MLYAIIAEDVPGSLPLRTVHRPAHLRRLEVLQDEGRLILAGPHPMTDGPDPDQAGFSGSLIVAEFPSLEEARRWADSDPYLQAGIYASVTVKPFVQVFPR